MPCLTDCTCFFSVYGVYNMYIYKYIFIQIGSIPPTQQQSRIKGLGWDSQAKKCNVILASDDCIRGGVVDPRYLYPGSGKTMKTMGFHRENYFKVGNLNHPKFWWLLYISILSLTSRVRIIRVFGILFHPIFSVRCERKRCGGNLADSILFQRHGGGSQRPSRRLGLPSKVVV